MNFSSIIGHDRAVSILKHALGNDTLAHAYLFAGEAGIGKRMTALALAAALNCDAPGPEGGCGNCPVCRRIAAGTHPDVHLLVPDGEEIKIDQVRESQADLSLKPFEGKRKILIVDGAEFMNDASANAFLKTLEEPPGDSLIILISAMPQGLLDTIRSRCQTVAFQPLSRHALAAALQAKRSMDAEDAWFLAALSRGSLGRALEMDVNEEKKAREELLAVLDGLGGMPRHEVLAAAEGIAKDREGFVRLLDIGTEWLRDLLVFHETGDVRLLVFTGSLERLRRAAEDFALPAILRDLDLFTQSRRMLERRVSAQLVAEHLLLALGRA
jgi:DNA polymerase-3 subunit delta'